MRLIDADKLKQDCLTNDGHLAITQSQIAEAETVEGFQWIPIKTRPLTDEERKENPEVLFYYDCPLPDDGEEVLVTTFLGDVRMDCFYRDPEDGCFFETYCDEDDVKAWARIPKPYKAESEE